MLCYLIQSLITIAALGSLKGNEYLETEPIFYSVMMAGLSNVSDIQELSSWKSVCKVTPFPLPLPV